MSFTPKKLTVAIMVALGAASLAQAQTATTEKTVITGSNIKRVDAEPVAPVDIITREDIERTGLPTVAEVLRNIPSNTGGSYNESFSNSFARGASGISLRGLGQKATLVLINGRRTGGYGLAQNLQDTFVDLNSIPSSAVERIEVLKDGASAVYGSDAIAGVVNIILRKDYRGAEVSGDVGFFEGKKDYRFTLTGGMGDLAKDKFNLFGTFDFYKREHLLQSDTEYLKSRDLRGEQGGRNFQSLTGGGTWRQLTAAGALTNNQRAITDCPGTVMTNLQAVDAGLLAATS
ncbi:MAG: TonB-dependent receptor plug domain-containing protein, partial [Betaproteobacteria bacterium]